MDRGSCLRVGGSLQATLRIVDFHQEEKMGNGFFKKKEMKLKLGSEPCLVIVEGAKRPPYLAGGKGGTLCQVAASAELRRGIDSPILLGGQ